MRAGAAGVLIERRRSGRGRLLLRGFTGETQGGDRGVPRRALDGVEGEGPRGGSQRAEVSILGFN